MNRTIIRNATIVNNGTVSVQDVLIVGDFIEKIQPLISLEDTLNVTEIDAGGKYLFPGVIDAQVHFREPGFVYKGGLAMESRAAVAGGVTSFMDMPNTHPATLTQELLEEKYQLASKKSLANYSFFMGVSQGNLSEVLKTNCETVCGVSDDGLYFNHEGGIISNYPYFLEELFSQCETLIALHSEDDSIIHKNTVHFKSIYGDDIPVEFHPTIRSREACLTSTKRIIEIAEKYKSRLHVLHVSSLDEVDLFRNDIGLEQKRITAEACTHHLLFSENDYFTLGNRIKWNPSIKSEKDRIALINGLINGKIDIISTDHAPHLIEEKEGNYFEVKSGGPLVQFSLQAILELYFQGLVDLPFVAEKMSHNVARLYKIRQRGFIHEGYFADLVLVDFNQKTKVNQSSILSKCKWSPFESRVFNSKISHTWVNGNLVYKEGLIVSNNNGKRLLFSKTR